MGGKKGANYTSVSTQDGCKHIHSQPANYTCRFFFFFVNLCKRSCEFCSLNNGRSASCTLTVHTGGSSAGQRRLDFLTPSSSFNTAKKLSSVLCCVTSVSIPVRSPMPWLVVGGSALHCKDQWVARRCQGGELRINSRPHPKTPTSTWRTHSADPFQCRQAGNTVLHQRLRTITVWGKGSPSVFIL